MSTPTAAIPQHTSHSVNVEIQPALNSRNRLTTAFRIFLAIPHILLVGGPIAVALSWSGGAQDGSNLQWAGVGLLGTVAIVAAIISWFAIVFGARHPQGLWQIGAFYLRWRVRAVSYLTMLRDEYPPFGEGEYAATLYLPTVPPQRDRLSVAFRIFLVIPHILIVWVLGIAWGCSSLIAWFAILFTGSYPRELYNFAVGVLRWNIRLEAYLLLLHDEYPPFSLYA